MQCVVPSFSKLLANMLKKILTHVITLQSAFTNYQLISNNILTTYESLHCMQNHNSAKDGFMALKLDMSKAYNLVEWSFLETIMRKLGFNEH